MSVLSRQAQNGFPRNYLRVLLAFKHLMRIGNCLMGILMVVIGSFAVFQDNIFDHIELIIPACAVAFFLMAGGNMINDVFDVEVDRSAHPTRAIPRGIFSRRFVLFWALSFYSLALFFAMLINLNCFIFALAAEVLLLLYELYLKKYPGIGNVVIGALVGSIFLGTAAAIDQWKILAFLGLLTFLINVAREMIKDIEDIEGDVGRNTFPKKFGVSSTLYAAWSILIVTVILFVMPYYPLALFSGYLYLVGMASADLVIFFGIFSSKKNAKKGQQLLKFAMLLALVAFLLGNWF